MTEEAATDTAAATATPAPEGNATQQPQGTETPQTPSGETPNEAPTASETPDFSLPDEYKDKPWAEKIKSQEDAYKQIDNLTALVGKKTIAPIDYDTASAEEIAAYHQSIVPENAEYKFNDNSMPEFVEPMQGIFKEAGLHPSQAKIVTEGFDNLVEKLSADIIAADTSEEGYLEMMKESFGDDYEKSVATVEGALKQFASDQDKQVFDVVDNKTRAAVDRTTNNLVNFYEQRIKNILDEHGVVESGAQTEGGEGKTVTESAAEQRSKIRAEMRELDGKPNGHKRIAELQVELNKLL